MGFPFNGLEIHQIDEILKGGAVEPYSKKTYTITLIEKFIKLGWTKKFIATKFNHLTDKLLEDWTDDIFIIEYINYLLENTDLEPSLLDNLYKIGLSKKVAKNLDLLFGPLTNTCYTHIQLVILAVEHLLGKNDPITDSTTTHYFKPNLTDIWFNINDIKPKIINISQRCTKNISEYIQNIIDIQFPKESFSKLYFHTTSWSGCISILDGIERFNSRICLDFGQTPGFYMSPALADSLEWGEKNNKNKFNEIALIIFSLPKIFPESLIYKHLKGEEWISVTQKSRRCNIKDTKIKEIEKCDLIYGNMVSNPEEVRKGNTPQTHTPPKKQLVSKRDKSDEYIHNRITGCIFFQKYISQS